MSLDTERNNKIATQMFNIDAATVGEGITQWQVGPATAPGLLARNSPRHQVPMLERTFGKIHMLRRMSHKILHTPLPAAVMST